MMPVFTRPRQAIIIEDGPGTGALALIVAVLAAGTVAGFVLAHLELLAACAAVFVVAMGSIAAGMRWAASPRRLHPQRYARPTVPVLPPRPAQDLPAPRPKAIGAPRSEVHSRPRPVAAPVTQPAPDARRPRPGA